MDPWLAMESLRLNLRVPVAPWVFMIGIEKGDPTRISFLYIVDVSLSLSYRTQIRSSSGPARNSTGPRRFLQLPVPRGRTWEGPRGQLLLGITGPLKAQASWHRSVRAQYPSLSPRDVNFISKSKRWMEINSWLWRSFGIQVDSISVVRLEKCLCGHFGPVEKVIHLSQVSPKCVLVFRHENIDFFFCLRRDLLI